MSECLFCNGSGYLPVTGDPTSRRRCKCTTEALYRAKLGHDIMDAPRLKESRFAGLVEKDLFIVANRKDFLPHLRYVLVKQGLNFFSRVTNDSAILDAWFAKERNDSKEEAHFTSVVDLVEAPDLLILFLGVLSYSNRAMPGKMLEALRIRSFHNKPTWIVNPHSFPFSAGHLCWSPESSAHIKEHFREERIDPDPNWKPMRLDKNNDTEQENKPHIQLDGLNGEYL